MRYKITLIHPDHVASDTAIFSAISNFTSQQAVATVRLSLEGTSGGAGGGGGGSGGGGGGGATRNSGDKRPRETKETPAEYLARVQALPVQQPWWATRDTWDTPVPVEACLKHKPPQNPRAKGRDGYCNGKRCDCGMVSKDVGGKGSNDSWLVSPIYRYCEQYGIKIPTTGESAKVANDGASYKG